MSAFSSGHNLWVPRSSPMSGSPFSRESAIPSPSDAPPTPARAHMHTRSLSHSQILRENKMGPPPPFFCSYWGSFHPMQRRTKAHSSSEKTITGRKKKKKKRSPGYLGVTKSLGFGQIGEPVNKDTMEPTNQHSSR